MNGPGARTVVRRRVRVEGTVQGVGFRPFVHGLAHELGLNGFVGNDERGVHIEVEGSPDRLDAFLAGLRDRAPRLAVIERLDVSPTPVRGEVGFEIQPSSARGERQVLVAPDVSTCPDCLAELADPGDRRHRYPFTNCTSCGPRYSIVRDVPYDRPNTTMAGFELCPDCAAEYHDPGDRRFHAQPVCCPRCGPRLRLLDHHGRGCEGDPVAGAARLLASGAVVAVKGLGGYHLAVDAADEAATATLRARKHREDKPFALMAADLDAARELCEIDVEEAKLLTDPAAPIVLLTRRGAAPVAASVAPGRRELGVMLPYTPLHHLLLAAHGRPIVLTSGNVADEPIAFRDDDARERLAPVADGWLTHDRPIHTRVDDSVTRVVRGRPTVLRRSRGYAPAPIAVPWPFPRHLLAVGAELKSTVCLAKDHRAWVSHHIGDLENLETFRSFAHAIDHLSRLFDVHPEVVAHDLHPEYLSTKHALDLTGVDLVGVQHHHAHVVSCLADNGVDGPVIGVAFDGTGYGRDGTVWGGEVLVADRREATRAAHLGTVPLPGGAAAVREPWRMALAHLDAAYDELPRGAEAVLATYADRSPAVLAMIRAGVRSPATSSVGRLFDAVAALTGIRGEVTYEGQAAIELEQAADPVADGGYPVTLAEADVVRWDPAPLVRAVVDDLLDGVPVATVAGRFHRAVAAAIVSLSEVVHERTGLGTVALSGGVFQNVLLLDRVVPALERRGLTVLTHHRVPPNDGGISLGQAVIAGAV